MCELNVYKWKILFCNVLSQTQTSCHGTCYILYALVVSWE